ncbi:MAG: hypothetical protein EOQ55_23845 [Mesorhizobium sp.]|nr:MAG: hypothetical protein EOQ55_23845 [Mesorhizobium sp.]
MDVWDNDFLDLVEEAHLTFKGAADGEIAFGALKGSCGHRSQNCARSCSAPRAALPSSSAVH